MICRLWSNIETMKIAYLLHQFPSRTETFIAREIDALRAIGFDIEIFALEAGPGAHALGEIGGAWERVKRKVHGAAYFENLGREWAQRERDGLLRGIEHLHAGWASFPAEIACGAARELGVHWSFSGHARDLWVDGRDWESKLQAATFAAVCTRQGARFLQAQVPICAAKVHYLPHGIPLAKFAFEPPTSTKPEGPLRLLSVGRLVPKKGLSRWLQVLAALPEVDWQAVIIGDGPERDSLEKQLRELNLESRVFLVGALEPDAVIDAMHEADALVLPSQIASDGDRDGLPNVLLEAGACGLPIVATNVGGVSDFCDHSSAYLCDDKDDDLARSVRELWHDWNYDRATLVARCQCARERVQELFAIEPNGQLLAAQFRAALETSS